MMEQRDIQTWNDAVAACRAASWSEVKKIEAEAASGMPSPARSIVCAVGNLHKAGDERQKIVTGLTSDDFPALNTEETD